MNRHTWIHAGTIRLPNGDRYRLERCQACGATRKTTTSPPPDGARSCEMLQRSLKCSKIETIGSDKESGRI